MLGFLIFPLSSIDLNRQPLCFFFFKINLVSVIDERNIFPLSFRFVSFPFISFSCRCGIVIDDFDLQVCLGFG